MRLIINHKDMTVQSGSMPVRWCLFRKELEELKERGVEKAHVLIIIKNGHRQDRHLVPIDQMMTYIQFHRPGENTVYAAIVWHEEDNVKELLNYFLNSHSRGSYRNSVLEYGGKLYSAFNDGCRRFKESEELTITVPKELFAEEPSDFERWWVNLWHEMKQVDECDFRKRRMSAYSVQPPIVLVWVICITIVRFIAALILSIAGMRGTNWNPVIHPFRYGTRRVWSGTTKGDSVFWCREDGTKYTWYARILTPPVYVITIILLTLGGFLNQLLSSTSMMPWWYYAVAGVMLPFAVVTVSAVAYAIFTLVEKLVAVLIVDPIINWITSDAWKQKRAVAKEREQRAAEEKQLKERLAMHEELEELLACNGELQPSISALPPEKRTVRLRFLDLKAQVCKPYAQ